MNARWMYMMRVLILTQWYPPEPALLIQELAQTLQEMGHEVAVLTGFPNYPSGKIYPGYKISLRYREIIADVPVIRVPLYPDHSKSGLKRVLNYLSFSLSATFLGGWKLPRPDVIFVYHPPLTIGLPAFILAKMWSVPFVYQIQDMWPETLKATGMVNNSHLLASIGKVAKKIYAKADAICVISPGFKENLIAKGVSADKIHVISNWVDANPFDAIVPDPDLADMLGLSNRFNIMFAGNMGEAQGLEAIIETASSFQEIEDIQFVFVGDGIALPRLQELVQENGLTNVRFLGRFTPEQMAKLYVYADVLLVHLKDDPLFRITVPHKILDYLAAGKPILVGVRGDAADLVLDVGAGIASEPENIASLSSAIRFLYNMPDIERHAMGKKGYLAAKTIYSREVLVKQVEELLRHVVDRY